MRDQSGDIQGLRLKLGIEFGSRCSRIDVQPCFHLSTLVIGTQVGDDEIAVLESEREAQVVGLEAGVASNVIESKSEIEVDMTQAFKGE